MTPIRRKQSPAVVANAKRRAVEDDFLREVTLEAKELKKAKKDKTSKEFKLTKQVEYVRYAVNVKQFKNVTSYAHLLRKKTRENIGARAKGKRGKPSMIESFLKVIPLLLLRLWHNAIYIEFDRKRSSSTSRRTRSKYRPLGFLEHLRYIAVSFFHASYSQCVSMKEVLDSFKAAVDTSENEIDLCRLRAWRAACVSVDIDEFVAQMEASLQNNTEAGTDNIIDESLPLATHYEALPFRELVCMSRKPANVGFLIYQCVMIFDMTGLPVTFGFQTVRFNHRVSAAEAFLHLLRTRYTSGRGKHISIIADSAFSSRDVRCLVALNATMTDGIAVDLTLSANVSWEKKLFKAMSYRLARNEYRVFFSPLTQATVVLFKVRGKDNKDHLIIRWSNAYMDPTPGLGNMEAEDENNRQSRYSEKFARLLLKAPTRDLNTLATDLCRPSPVLKAYDLVHTITGIDIVALDIAQEAAAPDDSDVLEIRHANTPIQITVATLRKKPMKWLKAFCLKYHLCPIGSKTKEALITTMILASKVTNRERGDEVESFIADTKMITLENGLEKEDVLPDPVPQYKFKFKSQDVLDHYFSSIDVKTKTKEKYARLFEIYFFFGVVNSWTRYMERLTQFEFKGNRTAYLQYITQNPTKLPSQRCNIRTTFVKKLRDVFYHATEQDSWVKAMF